MALKGTKSSFPSIIKPMLCTLVAEPFTKEGWLYEIKWDGYRILAYKLGKNIVLRSRSGLDYSDRYTAIFNAVKKLKSNVVLDGEVVAFDDEGRVNFDLVQSANPDAPLAYYVFDIIWKDGYDLKELPLSERKKILKSILPANGLIKFSEDFPDGNALYEQAQKLEFEGIVAKKEESVYQPGKRGKDWLKIPTAKRQEFVIGAWAESEKARSFRSLLFGAYNNKGEFEWIGRSGGGFKEKEMPGILKKLKALEIKESPFVNKILDTKGAVIHYVKPELVANFKFATWTESGRIRKPATFLGFRTDKKAQDVVREIPLSPGEEKAVVAETKNKKSQTKKAGAHLKTAHDSNWPKLEKIRITNTQNFNVDNCTVQLTNVDRELWKGISKADLIMYYSSIADYILPHIKDRPLSLHIKHIAPTEQGLYIKDMEGRQPDCAEIFSTKRLHPKPGKRNIIDYLVCNNIATLLWLINLGCIDLNPWSSRTVSPKEADYISIDLDPSDENFNKVIETTNAAKEFFDQHKIKAFIKTSGKTGLHIFIPCEGIKFGEGKMKGEARTLAENICSEIHDLVPGITTLNVSVSSRGDKLYIDPSQNDYADTLASAYSCRPYYLPTVSTPLEWKEMKQGLHPQNFTIKTILKRLETKGDLWKQLFDEATRKRNTKILKTFL